MQDSAVNFQEIEEALVIVKQRREKTNPELDFLQKVDEEHGKGRMKRSVEMVDWHGKGRLKRSISKVHDGI